MPVSDVWAATGGSACVSAGVGAVLIRGRQDFIRMGQSLF